MNIFLSCGGRWGEREGEGEGEREEEGEEEEELLPDRSELSPSLLLDELAERERWAGFFFLLIFVTLAGFFFLFIFNTFGGGSMIISSGSISFDLPFNIDLSKFLISSTCNARASINDR